MEDYVEDYKYNNCFWKKSGVLYAHAEAKIKEYLSIGEMLTVMADGINQFYCTLTKILTLYKPSDDDFSTRSKGIQIFLSSIKNMTQHYKILYSDINKIAKDISEKQYAYNSKKDVTKLCDDTNKEYHAKIKELQAKKKIYIETVNKAIEHYLGSKFGKKLKNSELDAKKKAIVKKGQEYKDQIEAVEKCRVEYMEIQGNIFAYEEEFERNCTNDLKGYLIKYNNKITDFSNKFAISPEGIAVINEIDGEKDNKDFAEKNKSLMTGPKRNQFKEYSQDLNYYIEHFDFIKQKLKGKSQAEIREMHKQITLDVNSFLSEVIKEKPDEIHKRIEGIAKNLKENKLTDNEFNYLIDKFHERFEQFKIWKNDKVAGQDFRKVGKEWDDRFCYMHTFLGYFNKTRVENKELDSVNFKYLCDAMNKILELNENEDADYSLCDLVVILSSTFYMTDSKSKNGKKYVNEVIKKSAIMQRQGFWVGLTKFELNEEIQQQTKEEDTLREDVISEEKLSNSVIAKLMSVSYNIIQFVTDSGLFNRIISDIFKYCKISHQSREIVVGMMEAQIEAEGLTHLKLDKDLLLKPDKIDNNEQQENKVDTGSNNNGTNEQGGMK